MPTLRNATTEPGYFVRWQSHPDHARPSTYQITNRALRLLREMGYTAPSEGDEVEIPHEVCHPLRVLGDLHFKDEESPGNIELNPGLSIHNRSEADLSPEQEVQLREYIETHPRLSEEKETELSDNLDRLNSDADVQLDASLQTGNTLSDGPAGTVNVDPYDFFDDESILESEIKEIVQGKEPVNVGEESPEDIEEVMGQLDRDEYYEAITEVTGYKNSLREFEHHPRDVITITLEENVLQYTIESIEHPEIGKWIIQVLDGRREGDAVPDLRFNYITFSDEEPHWFEHEVQLDDGQFVHWSVKTGGEENITMGITEAEKISGAQFHRVLHDRNWILQTIEDFVDSLENATIDDPAEWSEFD